MAKGRRVLLKKRNSDGELTRYKARFVGKGFTQREGIDFCADRVSAPVCRLASVRTIIARAALDEEELTQADVGDAYLNAEMDANVHMELPEGFEQAGADGRPRVARVKRCLFGFRQSGRLWNNVIDNYLLSIGFTRSKSDPCVYKKINPVVVVLSSGLVLSVMRSFIQEITLFHFWNFGALDKGVGRPDDLSSNFTARYPLALFMSRI